MKSILVIFIFITTLFAKTDFSDPKPSFDNPRKMVVQISSENEDDINHVLSSINNILKEYPTGTIEVAVVCYYHGLKTLRKDIGSIRERVESLQTYDVEFIACKNTMQSKQWTPDMLIDNITYVQAGLAEVMERVVAGWINIRP